MATNNGEFYEESSDLGYDESDEIPQSIDNCDELCKRNRSPWATS
jgi:hypothetical protein